MLARVLYSFRGSFYAVVFRDLRCFPAARDGRTCTVHSRVELAATAVLALRNVDGDRGAVRALYCRVSSFSFGRALVNRAPLPRRGSILPKCQAVLRRARQLVVVE